VGIVLDTKNEAGKTLTKNIVVASNDPANPDITLVLSGKVEEFAVISPKTVKLVGGEGQKITQTVTVQPGEKYPFKILGADTKKGENIRVAVQESGGPLYRLLVENLKKDKGRYFDTIYLKTDNPLRPVIEIGVFGIIS
jgi:hypothetical protein